MKNTLKQNKGITLIALVITIIVLLILAGVTIAMLSGENGILSRATETRATNAEAQADEQAKLAYMGVRTEIIAERVSNASYNAQANAGKLAKMVKGELTVGKWTVEPATESDSSEKITMTFEDSSLNNTNEKAIATNKIVYTIDLPGAGGTTVTLLKNGVEMTSGGSGGSESDDSGTGESGSITGVDYGSKTATTIEVGEDLTIGTEQFRVLKTDKSSQIIAVPFHNITLSTTNPEQTTDYSSNYSAFANDGDKYWKTGQDDIDWTNEKCLIGPYVQAYSDKLSLATGGKVTARLGRYSEFQDSAITLPEGSTVTKDQVRNPAQASGGNFWLGSGTSHPADYVHFVNDTRRQLRLLQQLYQQPRCSSCNSNQHIINQKETKSLARSKFLEETAPADGHLE